MHVVTSKASMEIRGSRLEANVPYLMNTTGVGSLLTNRAAVRFGDGTTKPVYRLLEVRPAKERFLCWRSEYDRIYFFRGGGFGDCLMMTSPIRLAKSRWPNARITAVTMREYGPIFDGICEWQAGFLREDQIATRDGCVFFEGVIEDNEMARELPGPEMFATHAFGGICPVPPKDLPDPIYRVSGDEAAAAREKFPPGSKTRIGIQPLASAACRTYPPRLTFQLAEMLVSAGHQVVMFGKPGTIDASELDRRDGSLINLADLGLSFRESCAVLATCKAAVVPDSALQHVAAALKIPAVSLWGAFPWRLRVPNNSPGRRFQPIGKCSPCFHHETGSQKFPEGRACEIAGFCTVMAQTSPQEIFEAVEGIIRKTL